MGSTSTMTMMTTSSKNNDNEDSTSISDPYTDPEHSAPTECLAEFLTSIMRKDYANALKYCKMSNLNDNMKLLFSFHINCVFIY